MSTVTVTPTVELDAHPPRVKLDVSDANLPAYGEVTVTRQDSSGRTVPVRTPDGNPLTLSTSGANRIGTVYDNEVPYGEPVSYSTTEDPGTVSAQVTVDETRVWLTNPGVPELSMPIELRAGSLRVEEWALPQAVFWPMGRETPVVHTDGFRKAPSTSLAIAVESLTEFRRLRTLLRDSSTLLLNIPQTLGFGFETSYVALGTAQSTNLTGIGADPNRTVEVSVQVVDRPAGGTQAERTYADLLVYASYTELQAAYSDYQSLLSGP